MKRLNVLLSIFVLALAVLDARAEPPQRIFGGNVAGPNDFTFIVSIRNHGNHHCGGTIISADLIVTAAHCISEMHKPEYRITVISGTTTPDIDGEEHQVSYHKVHEQYNSVNPYLGVVYDIGILKLAKPMKFNNKQRPIRLPVGPPDYEKPATCAGWGAMGEPLFKMSPKLLKVDMWLMTGKECAPYYMGTPIGENHICTYRGKGFGICPGDSGSPLVQNGYFIGIVSGGAHCEAAQPDIYTFVYRFKSFINRYL